MEVKNIFVIEDDEFFAQTFKKRLAKIAEFEIHHFDTCETALGQLLKIKPEIIFLDHILGGLNGVDALPLFKESLPNCEIVIVSGQSDPDVIIKADKGGATKYFRKDVLLMQNAEGFIKEYDEKSDSRLKKFWGRFSKEYLSFL
ncbi:MAG: DNA-binding NarL/FixJ family response regulator [Arenicella sp.]|jgi:DNA-binding NarL/FixJ family response regulator